MSASISIVTITFNDVIGLRRTAASIATQNNSNFEWLVVDGGSSDGTLEFLKDFKRLDKYISERDAGIYDAMKKGLNLATGEYILFLNSGDELRSVKNIDNVISFVGEKDVYFFASEITTAGFSHIRLPRDLISAQYSVPAIQQSTLYKKSVLKSLAWPTHLRICGDYSIAAQLLKRDSSYECSEIVLSKFELGGVSTFRPLALAAEAWGIQRDVLQLGFLFRLITAARRVLTGFAVLFIFRFKNFRRN